MGLLKLGSIYKKKSKKEAHVPALPRKPEPLTLELNLQSSIDTPITSPLSSNINNTVPAGSGSLFDDIFAELGTKPTKPKETEKKEEYSVMDNDFSLALALSQQLELNQDNTKRMTGPAKTGNKPPTIEKKANDVKPPTFLLGDDSIYSNYLKGLSALDTSEPSSSLSTSMFDSILNKSTPSNNTTNTNGLISPPVTSPTTPSNHVTQVVLDSDISDSDDSKLSDDSDEELHMQRNQRRMTKGVRPIMERRAQDNRVLVQRKVDNWSNRVDPEQHTAELNESMIERMKDRHRTQVKMAALRNQQQYQDELNYLPQHMVPQPYVPPAMMALPQNGVLQHPGLLMDPGQMYYPPPTASNEENVHLLQPVKPSVSVPAAFLPNPTHASLAVPHPPKEEEGLEDQHQSPQKVIPQRKSYFGLQPPINATLPQSNNQNRISGSTANISSPRLSSASSTSGRNNSSTATLERIDDEERFADSPVPMDSPSPVLEELKVFDDAVAAEEADAENSADEDDRATVASTSSRRKKSSRKLRQSQHEVAAETTPPPPPVENPSYPNHTVRASRSTPNFKKGKKKSASRSSSRRNSQDMAGSTPSESVTPPPLPHNSPYISYQSEENLYQLPRSSSQHQLHQHQFQYHQNQQHRQSLRHMKSEPELPRRSQSTGTQQLAQQQAQQQKLYQQQQQLNMEWERMQAYQREQLLKQQHHSQQAPYAPMYPMYYNSHGMMDKPYTQSPYAQPYAQPPHPQPPYAQPPYAQPPYAKPLYDPYQGPAYNISSHSKNKPNYYQSNR